jgi:DNA polymerase elongation subunit (family B)
MKFYTHFTKKGNYILERGYENGKRYSRKAEYCPTLFVPAKEETGYKTLDGKFVSAIEMGTMRDAAEFIQKYESVENFPIYGSTNYAYVYINEQYPNEIYYDRDLIRIANIDIEVGSEFGFPEPDKANEPITAITFKISDTFHVFGCGKYSKSREDVTYYMCRDENDLILKFLDMWEQKSPDIITGWNIQFFDIPYLYNRIKRLMGDKVANRLSPYKMIGERTTTIHNRQQVAFDLVGISILDYLELYKYKKNKFTICLHIILWKYTK